MKNQLTMETTTLKTVFKKKCKINFTYFVVILLFLIFNSPQAYTQIFINEFMASNVMSTPEIHDFSDYPDWIELYNDSDKYISLSNYSITDDIKTPQKWIFPDNIAISPKGFIFLWADGLDEVPGRKLERPWDWDKPFTTKFYHIPFKLSKKGEEIALFDPQGALVDHIVFEAQLSDISYGRKPDGGDSLFYFGDPTPNKSNTTVSTLNTSFATAPSINREGGFYLGQADMEILPSGSTKEIRYTLDGSQPNENSRLYTSKFYIDSSTTIRAKSYGNNILPSKIETQTYIFDTLEFTLPIISITTDPKLLWNDTFGIYKNSIKQRKIPIKFEYFQPNYKKVLSVNSSLRLTGEYSFTYPQKSFTISSASKYGDKYLNYKFFKNVNNSKFKNIYLRNSGTPDNQLTMFRDAFCHSLVIDDMDIDAQAYQPAVTYVNGKFWGIYNIREKLKSDYFFYRHNADPNNLNLLEYTEYSRQHNGEIIVNKGDKNSYLELLNFIRNNSLKEIENYNYVSSKIDIDEYINYIIAQVFIGNHNWIVSNMKWWNENNETSKWRWILLDTDRSFGEEGVAQYNVLNNLLKGKTNWYNLQIKKLMENDDFKNEFIQRFAAYLNTIFRSEHTVHLLDSLQNNIRGIMKEHIKRWDIDYSSIKSMENWELYVGKMRQFAIDRPKYQINNLKSVFSLSGMYNLDLSKSNKNGKILINGVNIPRETMKNGKYFKNIPIRLEAIPNPGYKFVQWVGISDKNQITLNLFYNKSIKAIFAPTDECIVPSVIENDYTLDSSCDYYIAYGDINIKKGATLNIEQGVELRMGELANIIVNGSLNIKGTADFPVVIKSNSSVGADSWGGIIFDNASSVSKLQSLKILNATKGNIDLFPGVISGNNSDISLKKVEISNALKPFYSEFGNIKIDSCLFHSNNTVDVINIKYADTAIIQNCIFKDINSKDADAIDLDGVAFGIVKNNYIYGFTGPNSDGIDLGESCSNITIDHNYICNILDKGISIGQGSKAVIINNTIIGCGQGIGIKDFNSFADIDHNTFYKNDYSVSCFEKNIGAGGANAKINNSILSSSTVAPYFVDKKSKIAISYSISDTKTLPGSGNLNMDPLFKNESQLNLELLSNSPCINKGDPNSPKDSDGTRTDMGAKFMYQGYDTKYSIVINEINYHSGEEDSGDWVEFHNYGDNKIDLSNWVFMDDKNSHKYLIPQNTILNPNSYLVLVNDREKFNKIYGSDIKPVGEFSFSLDNKSDIVRLFDSKFKEIDFVEYKDTTPWSTFADGNGGSLLLMDYTKDNSLASSWFNKFGFPTPGFSNDSVSIDFKYHYKYGGCSGILEFINNSKGMINSWYWNIEDKQIYNKAFITHKFQSKGTKTVSLNISSNKANLEKSKYIKVVRVLDLPEIENQFSCSSKSFELEAKSKNKKIKWYSSKENDNYFWIGNIYKTPKLNSSKTYYVSSFLYTNCTSDRVPIKAEVFDTIIADFTNIIKKNKVIFENKSLNPKKSIWDFGDNTKEESNELIVKHLYSEQSGYKVKLYVEGIEGKCKDSTSTSINILELDDSPLSYISIYPNPTKGLLTLEFLQKSNVRLMLFDIKGKLKYEKSLKNTKDKTYLKLDISNYPNGLYLLEIKEGDIIATKKIFKY